MLAGAKTTTGFSTPAESVSLFPARGAHTAAASATAIAAEASWRRVKLVFKPRPRGLQLLVPTADVRRRSLIRSRRTPSPLDCGF
jgi:hypothetical protein